MTTTVLSIAGVDPSGGAGVLADIKTFSSLGAYGMGIITALTAQSTQGVRSVSGVEPGFVRAQWETLADDILPDAMKIGMLGTAAIANTVAEIVEDYRARGGEHVVLDPVMVATSGDRLLEPAAEDAIRSLVGRVSLITPNLPEAAVLLGAAEAHTPEAMLEQATALLELGARRVVLKAGHLGGSTSVDLYAEAGQVTELEAPRINTTNTHGTGCTLSSAIACLRPQRDDWGTACRDAKAWLTHALEHADELGVGHGHGPVHHFWNHWED